MYTLYTNRFFFVPNKNKIEDGEYYDNILFSITNLQHYV